MTIPGVARSSFPLPVVAAVVALAGLIVTALIGPPEILAASALLASAGVVAATVVLRSERDTVSALTLLLLLAFLIPASQAIGPLGGSATPATLFGLLLAYYWVIGRAIPGSRLATGPQPIRVAALFLGWATLASWAAAFARPIPGVESRAADSGLFAIAAAIGVTLVAADGIPSRDRLEALVRRLVTLGTLLAAFGIYQFYSGFDVARAIRVPGLEVVNEGFTSLGQRSGFRRVAATTLHPIEFGVVLAMVLPFALYLAFNQRDQTSWARRWLPVIVIGVAIPMTLSRAAVLGLVAVAVVLAPTWSGRRRLGALGFVAVGAIGLRLAIPGLIGTIRSLFSNWFLDTSIEGRTSDYGEVGRFIADSPLFGRGIRTFVPEEFFVLDNQYLLSLVDTGFLGLIALLALFVTAFALAARARRETSDPATRELAQTLAASVAVPAVTYATFDALSFPVVTIMTFLVIGMTGALWRIGRQATPVPVETSRG